MKAERFISVILLCLVFIMLCSCAPNPPYREFVYEEFVKDGYYFIKAWKPGIPITYTCSGFAEGYFSEKVILPYSGIKLENTNLFIIDKDAFSNTSIKEVSIFTDSVSKFWRCKTQISENAFYGCFELKTVTLKNVTLIEKQAFAYCAEGFELTFFDVIPCAYSPQEYKNIDGKNVEVFTYEESDWNPFEGIEDFKIFVPAEAVENYKTALGWRLYADHIFAIEE